MHNVSRLQRMTEYRSIISNSLTNTRSKNLYSWGPEYFFVAELFFFCSRVGFCPQSGVHSELWGALAGHTSSSHCHDPSRVILAAILERPRASKGRPQGATNKIKTAKSMLKLVWKRLPDTRSLERHRSQQFIGCTRHLWIFLTLGASNS